MVEDRELPQSLEGRGPFEPGVLRSIVVLVRNDQPDQQAGQRPAKDRVRNERCQDRVVVQPLPAWILQPAEQGNSLAQINLAIMNEKGYGTRRNIDKALKWYRKAAKRGSSFAKEALSRLNEE